MSGPRFLHFLNARLRSARLDVHGVREGWSAPMALIDATEGFGEDVWVRAMSDHCLTWQVLGADVVSELQAAKGVRARACERRIAFVRKGMPNHFHATGRSLFAHVYLSGDLLERVAEGLDIPPGLDGVLRDDLIFFADPTLRNHLGDYVQRGASPDAPTRLEMEARSLLIAERLITAHHGSIQVPPGPRGGLAPWQLRRTQEAMLARLDGAIGLADLAGIAGLSSTHFSRAFKQSIGLAPFRWLAERRIDQARTLLADARIPLSQVAMSCGFAAQPQFTTAFRKATGVTPGRWRRERAS